MGKRKRLIMSRDDMCGEVSDSIAIVSTGSENDADSSRIEEESNPSHVRQRTLSEAVAGIIHGMGIGTTASVLQTFADLLSQFIKRLGSLAQKLSENAGRILPCMADVVNAIKFQFCRETADPCSSDALLFAEQQHDLDQLDEEKAAADAGEVAEREWLAARKQELDRGKWNGRGRFPTPLLRPHRSPLTWKREKRKGKKAVVTTAEPAKQEHAVNEWRIVPPSTDKPRRETVIILQRRKDYAQEERVKEPNAADGIKIKCEPSREHSDQKVKYKNKKKKSELCAVSKQPEMNGEDGENLEGEGKEKLTVKVKKESSYELMAETAKTVVVLRDLANMTNVLEEKRRKRKRKKERKNKKEEKRGKVENEKARTPLSIVIKLPPPPPPNC